jgi:hypothetical protein
MDSGKMSRANLPETFLSNERQKSELILEANLLKAQGQFAEASDRFAEAAEIEERLAAELVTMGHQKKAFIHQFSAVSCWAQAGDLHWAITLGEQMLQENNLPNAQYNRVEKYMEVLHGRFVQWMSQWTPEPLAV